MIHDVFFACKGADFYSGSLGASTIAGGAQRSTVNHFQQVRYV